MLVLLVFVALRLFFPHFGILSSHTPSPLVSLWFFLGGYSCPEKGRWVRSADSRGKKPLFALRGAVGATLPFTLQRPSSLHLGLCMARSVLFVLSRLPLFLLSLVCLFSLSRSFFLSIALSRSSLWCLCVVSLCSSSKPMSLLYLFLLSLLPLAVSRFRPCFLFVSLSFLSYLSCLLPAPPLVSLLKLLSLTHGSFSLTFFSLLFFFLSSSARRRRAPTPTLWYEPDLWH